MSSDPLDDYVETILETELSSFEVSWLAYSHTLSPGPLPIQRIAHAVGLAHLGPAHLSIHPTHGPWIALRAVCVLSSKYREDLWPVFPLSQREPCSGCAAPCTIALKNAQTKVEVEPNEAEPSDTELSVAARRWLRVRDVCPLGKESRYTAQQIRYHYDKDPGALHSEHD